LTSTPQKLFNGEKLFEAPYLQFAVLPLKCSAYEGKGQQNKSLMNTTTMQKDYTAWTENVTLTDEQIAEEQEANEQREIGKQHARQARVEYDETWNGYHGNEIRNWINAKVEVYA
jgi:hypothetical protein